VESAPDSLREYEERALHGAVLGPAEYRECLDDLAERLGREVGPGDVEPFLWELSRAGMEATPEEVERAARWGAAWAVRTRRWFASYDLLVTPTVCDPAPPLVDLDPRRLTPLELLERMVPHMAFTEPWNATGQPAVSVPLAYTEEGLPIGVQLIAGVGGDALLLAVAASLLETREGAPDRRPPIHA
jgi:amidase